jgi:hypothetical protein
MELLAIRLSPRAGKSLVIPAQAGIQLIKKTRVARQSQGLVRFAEYLFRWIPACAGTTKFGEFLFKV